MNIELQRALSPDSMGEWVCGLCGEEFVRDSVLAMAETEDRGHIGEVCPECVGHFGSRDPERFPTAEDYRRALKRYPEPLWKVQEEYDEASLRGDEAYFARVAGGDIEFRDLRAEPSEEGMRERIRRADAFSDCMTSLIDAVGVVGGDAERWNNIRKHVFPVLRRESVRLEKEARSYKEALKA